MTGAALPAALETTGPRPATAEAVDPESLAAREPVAAGAPVWDADFRCPPSTDTILLYSAPRSCSSSALSALMLLSSLSPVACCIDHPSSLCSASLFVICICCQHNVTPRN